MIIYKCDICGKTDKENNIYIRQFRRAIFEDYGEKIICYDYVHICQTCCDELMQKSGGIYTDLHRDKYISDNIERLKKLKKLVKLEKEND